jgi:hypothetical protein
MLPHYANGKALVLDITVVNAQQAALVRRVAKDGGAAVAEAHTQKLRKYEDRCRAEGLVFAPLAVESFGGWHPTALDSLSKLGRQLARVVGRGEDETVLHLKQRLGVLLVRDTMQMVQSRAPEHTPPEVDGLE